MEEIKVIRYLLNEIESELKYKSDFDEEQLKAMKKQEEYKARTNRLRWLHDFMDAKYSREPKRSIVAQNAKIIRRLLLKFY